MWREDEGGEMIGRLGVLASDGEKVQCHICGKWFGHLGAHVKRAHDTEADDYKREFGLKKTTGLIGPALADRRREHSDHLREISDHGLANVDREQRRKWMKDREIRLEQRLDPRFEQHLARIQELARETAPYRGGQFSDKARAKSRATWEKLLRDEAWATRWRDRISRSKGYPKTFSCPACGKDFTLKRWTGQKTCGRRACLLELKRQAAVSHKVSQRPEVRQKIRAKALERDNERDSHGRFKAANH